MTLIREQATERMRRDHECMIGLIERIKASCTKSDEIDNCNLCQTDRRQVCHGNIEQLVKAFVETTLKHNVIESLLMDDGVPKAHRVAHNRAHQAIAEQVQSIRIVLSQDGNCVLAIEGIDTVLATLSAHFSEYDQLLESYLLAA